MDEDDPRYERVFVDTHGHDGDHTRWIFSYSDLVTLLLALFIVLYSLSSVNEKKVQELNQIMKEAFDKKSKKEGDSHNTSPESPKRISKDIQSNRSDFVMLKDTLHEKISGPELMTQVRDMKMSGEYIELTLNADMLFSPGSAFIDTQGRGIIEKLAKALLTIPYPIRVEGHTDDQPIETILYPSNWELSVARSASVVRYLDYLGLNPRLLSAIGYGSEFPIASNQTVAGRNLNRRVVIIISKDDARFKALLESTLAVEKQE